MPKAFYPRRVFSISSHKDDAFSSPRAFKRSGRISGKPFTAEFISPDVKPYRNLFRLRSFRPLRWISKRPERNAHYVFLRFTSSVAAFSEIQRLRHTLERYGDASAKRLLNRQRVLDLFSDCFRLANGGEERSIARSRLSLRLFLLATVSAF